MGYKMNQAADVTFSNPPYNDNMDLKLIEALKENKFLKKIVCVHPGTWLIDTKTQIGNKSGYKKFRCLIKDFITSVEMFDATPVFGGGISPPCLITVFDFENKRNSKIKIKMPSKISGIETNETWYEVFSIDDITLHKKQWELVKTFLFKVKKYIEENGSLKTSLTSAIYAPKEKLYVQTARVRARDFVLYDFFTYLLKDPTKNKGIRNNIEKSIVFSFNTEEEQNNFLSYLQTDFARLCLSLTKTRGDLEYNFTPWLDFSQSWDDDKLFSFFGYPKGHPIREYAKTFLPDYHNLYPNGKTY